MSDLIIIGGSGHAMVVADLAIKNGHKIIGILDDNEDNCGFSGFERLGKVADCVKYRDTCSFVIGIGNNKVRKKIAEEYPDLNYATLIHPTASIAPNVEIKEGTVVMPMAVINTCAVIGRHTIINSGAVVEHECTVGDYCLIAPHATICGIVNIGNLVHMGAGCVVNQVINICDNVTVGSGGVVIKDITAPGTYVGVPVKKSEK